MIGNGDHAGRNEWLSQETSRNLVAVRSRVTSFNRDTGHNHATTTARMRFAANAAAARSPTLQRGVK
jgi:hypothetical protein